MQLKGQLHTKFLQFASYLCSWKLGSDLLEMSDVLRGSVWPGVVAIPIKDKCAIETWYNNSIAHINTAVTLSMK